MLIKHLAEGLKIGEAKLNSEILSTYNKGFGSASGTLTTRLKSCESNIPSSAIDSQCWADNLSSNQSNSIAHFRDQIIPLLDSLDLVVVALLEIVQNDETIDDSAEIGWRQHQTKQKILQQKEFFLDEFLAGVYYYVLRIKNKSCKGFISTIDEAFFAQLQTQDAQIHVHKTRSDSVPPPQAPDQLSQLVLPDGQSIVEELQKMRMALLGITPENATISGRQRRYGMFARVRSNGTLFELENPSNIIWKVDGLVRSAKSPNYKKALQLIAKAQIKNDGRCAEDELKLSLYRGLCYQGMFDFSRAAEAFETAALLV